MAPQDWGLWSYARYLKKLCPGQFNSAREAYARLQQIKMILADKGADFMVPCGKDNGQGCEVLRHLSGWNDILAAIQVQMKERVATGELELSFPIKSFDHQETKRRIQRAIVLLHLLLVKHACVTEIELDDLGHFNDREWFALFCDGVGECRRLKTLKINADIGGAICYKQLLTVCGFLKHLEELTFERICADERADNMVALEAVIASNTKLRRFEVGEFVAVPPHLLPILRALVLRHNISRLSLDVSYVTADDASVFLQMLNGNNVLQSLRLEGSAWQKYLTVNSIASALANATALVELELVSFRIHTHDAWVLAMSLVHRQTVQHLSLLYCMPVFSFPTSVSYAEANGSWGRISNRIEPYVHILQKLPSLRKLSLDLLRFTPEDQRAFFEALAANNSLHHVLVTPPYQKYPSELARIAHEAGTASRIHTGLVFTDETNFLDIPRGSRLHEVILEAWAGTPINEKQTVIRCFADLIMFDHVTKLTLAITGSIQLSSAKPLALYLKSTKCLKAVTLSFRASKGSNMLLLDAIARNTSITSLGVENWCQSRRSAVVLADVVCSSTMIHTLTYNRDSALPAQVFFSRLCKSIGSNFTIVSVNTFERRVNAKNWALIQKAAARNATFLERAARLVAGLCSDKIDAEALESVVSSPLLLPRVQELMSVSEREASRRLRETLIDLKELDVFMSIAGIVRESVVCEESSDGRPRLDRLPLECWLAIRRYLSVADVVNTGPERC
ncbi:hypothetical protein HPB49_023057 [Dermacentor silvarum]|uniref:Uncharacterized protein n=1 Tax=Dermacentor silvarum TaxID=543639 RepID=A0ACB8CN84_DERSI|nr:hypothetical protein HPB49_023057 [Dermacentor silvarum]